MQYKTVRVSDISQAAFLLISGYKIEHISRDGPVLTWHFIDDKDQINYEVQKYINGEAIGDCKKFSDALKTLKQTLRTN